MKLLSLCLIVATTSVASADRRLFTSTYEYSTVPEGNTTIDVWHTESRETWDANTPQALEEILEIEHGLTEHWDAALYTVFTQRAGDALVLHDMRLQSRYRFADRGELPVDIMVYGELAKQFGDSIYAARANAIFALGMDKVTLALNVLAGTELGNDVSESELELGWAAGASYELHPKLNFGVETFGEVEGVAASIGPALAVAPSSKFWFTLTAGFGITDDAAALSGRLIVGIEL
jgi:hypothetical protein